MDIPSFVNPILYTQLFEQNLKIIAKLGKGVNGEVYLVERTDDFEKYAIKVFEYFFSLEDMKFGTNLSDINFSLSLKHPYIIRSHKFFRTNNYMGILMDRADDDLCSYMNSSNLGYVEKIKFMYQIGAALDYLASLGYVHCDLKPNNILLKKRNILLADFGLTRIKEHVEPDFCQTYCYRAPELIYDPNENNKYTELFPRNKRINWLHDQITAEMWTFGLICLDIIYDKPFLTYCGKINSETPENEDEYSKLLIRFCREHEKLSSYETIISYYGEPKNPELLEVIANLFLQFNPDKRTRSYKEFLGNPIFETIHIQELYYCPQMPRLRPIGNSIVEKEGIYTPDFLSITTK